MSYINPGKIFLQKHSKIESLDDVLAYSKFLVDESDVDLNPPIDLGQIFSRFNMPASIIRPLPVEGLLINPAKGQIIINEDDPETRQRFTIAHELIEILFEELPQKIRNQIKYWGSLKESAKERICNIGAAQLLMPKNLFSKELAGRKISFDLAIELANKFKVSTQAALIQMTNLAPGRHAVVLWRYKNKPKDIKELIPENQLSFLEKVPRKIAALEVRIEWSFSSPNVSFIPKYKSVPNTSKIYKAWETGSFTSGRDYLEITKNETGTFFSENKPFQIENETQVLSFIHFPNDVCHW